MLSSYFNSLKPGVPPYQVCSEQLGLTLPLLVPSQSPSAGLVALGWVFCCEHPVLEAFSDKAPMKLPGSPSG